MGNGITYPAVMASEEAERQAHGRHGDVLDNHVKEKSLGFLPKSTQDVGVYGDA